MGNTKDTKGTLVTGIIGEDVHIIGIRIVEHALRNAGLKIVPLAARHLQKSMSCRLMIKAVNIGIAL